MPLPIVRGRKVQTKLLYEELFSRAKECNGQSSRLLHNVLQPHFCLLLEPASERRTLS